MFNLYPALLMGCRQFVYRHYGSSKTPPHRCTGACCACVPLHSYSCTNDMPLCLTPKMALCACVWLCARGPPVYWQFTIVVCTQYKGIKASHVLDSWSQVHGTAKHKSLLSMKISPRQKWDYQPHCHVMYVACDLHSPPNVTALNLAQPTALAAPGPGSKSGCFLVEVPIIKGQLALLLITSSFGSKQL